MLSTFLPWYLTPSGFVSGTTSIGWITLALFLVTGTLDLTGSRSEKLTRPTAFVVASLGAIAAAAGLWLLNDAWPLRDNIVSPVIDGLAAVVWDPAPPSMSERDALTAEGLRLAEFRTCGAVPTVGLFALIAAGVTIPLTVLVFRERS
jgi:hypothetical protein